MSEFFVKTFKSENDCPDCPKRRYRRGDKTYSLCRRHLDAARDQWRHWAVRRRTEKRCCYCPRRSYNGWLRCREHTRINRENCRRWMAAHPDRAHEYWETRSKAYIAKGLCPYCKAHNPAAPGITACAPCRDRYSVLRRDPRVVVNGAPVRGRGLGNR